MSGPALSFVIPLYRSAETIGAVVRDIEALEVPGGHETPEIAPTAAQNCPAGHGLSVGAWLPVPTQ